MCCLRERGESAEERLWNILWALFLLLAQFRPPTRATHAEPVRNPGGFYRRLIEMQTFGAVEDGDSELRETDVDLRV